MAKLRFTITMSLDGYVAGPRQSFEQPLGEDGESLHEWAFATRSWQAAHGRESGEAGIDSDQLERSTGGMGAVIMGRNMFGPPTGGPWGDETWRGWWGEEPPYHTPVFILTHHAREPLEMQGGTTFHFVTDGIEAALERAMEAAAGGDVLLAGGASAAQQYLRAGLVDEMTIHVAPMLLGAGERLFEHLDGGPRGYECVELVSSPAVAHFTYVRRSAR
jgi:dihydrofolate reductase